MGCLSQGLVAEKKVFEVHIEQGHKHNARVTLRGEAGCSEPNVLPGDVVFILEQKPHAVFKRIAQDLIYEKVRFKSLCLLLSLNASCCAGWQRAFTAGVLVCPHMLCKMTCTPCSPPLSPGLPRE